MSVALLACATPVAWLEEAAERVPELLIDHANCEKKAAASALSLIFRYAADDDLIQTLSRLAREEMRHHEQVRRLMRRRGIAWRNLPASGYAAGLRRCVRTAEPGRRTDMLLIGAFIEARSCERFAALVPYLDVELGGFYAGLRAAEARHFEQYLALARRSEPVAMDVRIAQIAEVEADLVCRVDTRFAFHSGPPR